MHVLKLVISSALLFIATYVRERQLNSIPSSHTWSQHCTRLVLPADGGHRILADADGASICRILGRGTARAEDAASKALKREKFEKPYIYCRKGNKEQVIFNSCLDKTVAEAETELSAASSSTPSSSTTTITGPENVCRKVGCFSPSDRS